MRSMIRPANVFTCAVHYETADSRCLGHVEVACHRAILRGRMMLPRTTNVILR
jgi:hypothetical protein